MLGVRVLLHSDSGTDRDLHTTLTKLLGHLQRSEALIVATRHYVVPRVHAREEIPLDDGEKPNHHVVLKEVADASIEDR